MVQRLALLVDGFPGFDGTSMEHGSGGRVRAHNVIRSPSGCQGGLLYCGSRGGKLRCSFDSDLQLTLLDLHGQSRRSPFPVGIRYQKGPGYDGGCRRSPLEDCQEKLLHAERRQSELLCLSRADESSDRRFLQWTVRTLRFAGIQHDPSTQVESFLQLPGLEQGIDKRAVYLRATSIT